MSFKALRFMTRTDASNLDRITVKYVEREDRIRLAGQTPAGEAVIVWITRRLLDRLLPALTQRVESALRVEREDAPRASAMQRFAQQAARTMSTPQPPVRAGSAAAQWLAHSVDVSFAPRHVLLSFHGDAARRVDLPLEESKLRQLLNILYDLYRRADWLTDAWPSWMRPMETRTAAAGRQMH